MHMNVQVAKERVFWCKMQVFEREILEIEKFLNEKYRQ